MTDVLRQPAFRSLWLAYAGSTFGSAVHFLAIVWTALAFDAGIVGSVILMRTLVLLGFGMISGHIADRVPRKTVLIVSDCFSAGTVLTLAVVSFQGLLSPLVLIVAAAFLAVADQLHGNSLRAEVPNLVQREQLIHANGLLMSTASVASIVGGPVAGIVLANYSVAGAFAIDAASYGVSAILISRLPSSSAGTTSVSGGLMRSIAEGLRVIRVTPPITFLVVTGILGTLAFGPTPVALPVLVAGDLRGGPADYGALLSFGVIGSLSGPPIASRLSRSLSNTALLATGYATMAAASLALGVVQTVLFASAVFAIRSAGNALITTAVITILQAQTSDATRGRVISTATTLQELARPVTLAPAGPVIELIGARPVFAVQGAVLGLVALSAIQFGRRAKRLG